MEERERERGREREHESVGGEEKSVCRRGDRG